ncbi:MAG: potassium transporter [Chloroflexota bacterium]|nr:NAD-binding protein [Caldilinea sp.]GIK73601.1 MAG: potassium transporter [Chloroflexota bacterium]
MKFLIPQLYYFWQDRHSRVNVFALLRYLLLLAALVTLYSILFHLLMAYEGRQESWVTGFYWTLTVMSTLGFGDITFQSDLGRIFSSIVLLSGIIFLLVILPFTFIELFYAPWLKAQEAARAPSSLPDTVKGHVILTQYDAVTSALIEKLNQYHYRYVLLTPDLDEALRLHDLGVNVVRGDLDNPETYRRVHVEQAALVATTANDRLNTNVAFTVREVSDSVPVITTANASASVDILELAGCNHVLQLGEMLGQALVRRITGGDTRAHIIGRLNGLVIAEATVRNTPLVGQTLAESKLRDKVGVTVLGIWERGQFNLARPDTRIEAGTVLVLSGSEEQIAQYNALLCTEEPVNAPVVIIGGGRVGRAAGRALLERGMDYRIVELLSERMRDPAKYVIGDAADLEVLVSAGIRETPAVLVTTHDDDTNIYLTIYCRRLRPDVQIISRARLERNVATLHRAGADFVLSYASMGASAILNLLNRGEILMVAEGLDVFEMQTPASLVGKTIAESNIRALTGCTVVAIEQDGVTHINPDPFIPLPADAQMILIGTVAAENRFLKRFTHD